MLLHATEAVYEDSEDDPYDGGDPNKIGYTAAAIAQLCRDLCVPIHIKWGGSKIESFTPGHSHYDEIALYIWGGPLVLRWGPRDYQSDSKGTSVRADGAAARGAGVHRTAGKHDAAVPILGDVFEAGPGAFSGARSS